MPDALPGHARVVIIGAGVVGCSVAFHLTRLGWADVVVLERHEIGCGTTWHSAGNVTVIVDSPAMMGLFAEGARLYPTLEAETGQAVGWRNCGRVMLARTPERMTELRRIQALGRVLGVELDILSPEETAEKLPLFRTDDLVGAAFSPGDGRVNPTDLAAAYVKGAKARGARFIEGARVTGVRLERGAVRGVDSAAGSIDCEVVVNCAGLWAKRIGELCGVSLPLYANEHFYMLTRPIDGVTPDMPTFRDPDALIYGREDVGGLLVGCFDTDAKALPVERLPEDFSFALLNEDWDRFGPYMEAAMARIPALETAEVRMLLNGPESFTPDGNPLLGAAPGLVGYYVLAAMNSAGVCLSAGTGRALAEWIVEGEPTMDLHEVDVRRFAPFHGNEAWLRQRASEMPSFHFMVGGPGHDFASGRMLRRSALHDRLAGRGARFTSTMGWERADWFDGGDPDADGFARVAAEYEAARQAAALFDRSHLAKILVEGRDSGAALQALAAADLAIPPGTAVEAPFLNDAGGVESCPLALRLAEDRWLLLTGAAQITRDLDWLRRQTPPGRRVVATDVSSAWAVLALRGPAVPALLARVGTAGPAAGDCPPGSVCQAAVGQATGLLLHGPDGTGWQLLLPTEFAAGAYEALAEAGASLGLRDAGHRAWECLRIEAARPLWGRELRPALPAIESGLDRVATLDKALAFKGRDAVRRQRAAAPTGALRAFTVEDRAARPCGGEPILCDGAAVGLVSSACFGHGLGGAVVMGRVQAPAAAGTWALDLAGERLPLAPYQPDRAPP